MVSKQVKVKNITETKRVPLKDYTNVISTRKNVNKSIKIVLEGDNSLRMCTRMRKSDTKMPQDNNIKRTKLISSITTRNRKGNITTTNYQDKTEQVLNDMNNRKCQVLLKKDKLIENKIIKVFGNKIVQNNDTKKVGENNKKIINSPKKNLRATKNLDHHDTELTKRNLRKRNSKQNFAEKSLNVSLDSSDNSQLNNNKDKRPIYRRLSQLKEPKKKKNSDVYTFDFSSENDTTHTSKKKKKTGHSLNTSLPFERYMKEIVMKLDEKHHKETVKTKKNPKKGKTQDKKIDTKERIQKNVNVNKEKMKNDVLISNLPINKEKEKIKIISDVKIVKSKPKNIENFQNQFTSTPLHERERERNSSPDIFESLNNEENISDDHLDYIRESLNKTPNVNHLHQLNSTSTSKIVNNSMINDDIEASPWRFNVEVRRNPHFLQYKRSLLPNYNQEMVLDSSLIEKQSFNKSTNNQSTSFNVNVSAQKQTSILKYVSGGKNIENLDNINFHNFHQSSLFDAHDFSSPEKRKSPKKQSLENKENKHVKKKVDVVRRNILGLKKTSFENTELNSFIEEENDENIVSSKTSYIQKRYSKRITLNQSKDNILCPKIDNEQNVQSSIQENVELNQEFTRIENNQTESEKEYDTELSSSKSDFFGFDVSESHHEAAKSKSTPRRMEVIINKLVKEQKNVRFEVNKMDKKTSPEKIDEPEANLQEIGFFDYQENEREIDLDSFKQYKPRRRKRRRSASQSGTESEDDDKPQRHRKKKNERTKEEEAAAEKWYTEFNKMCEEVDKFPLEIEKVK